MIKRPCSILALVLGLLISLPLPPAAAQEDLPRAEMTLVVDWSAVEFNDTTHETFVDLLKDHLGWEPYLPAEFSWLDETRLRVVMPGADLYDLEDVMDQLKDPLLLVDPDADPAVQIEFVDFSQYAPGQIAKGTCILTTARIAQAEANLGTSGEPPVHEDYTCPATPDHPQPETAQLQPDGTPFVTVMTGAGLGHVMAEPDNLRSLDDWRINFSLAKDNPEVEAFVNYTAENIGRPLAIVLDGRVLSAPTINQPLTTGGVITGSYTRFEAVLLAAQLQGGVVPIPVAVERVEVIFMD